MSSASPTISWNFQLEYQFTKIIKELWPKTVVVFGGPNYGLEPEEIESFWRDYPDIDFYIAREGEGAFVALMDALPPKSPFASATRFRATLKPLSTLKTSPLADDGGLLSRTICRAPTLRPKRATMLAANAMRRDHCAVRVGF